MLTDIVGGIIIVPFIGLLAFKLRAVDLSGLISGIFIGLSIFCLAGWRWFIVIFFFFASASLATRVKYETKRRNGVAEEKGGARRWGNVLGNGLVAAMASAMYFITSGNPIYLLVFLGSVSTACADTIATEIGLTSNHPPRLIVNPFKIVGKGESGGVTLRGKVAGSVSSLLTGLLMVPSTIHLGIPIQKILTISVLSGFIGETLDSFMGATIQGIYRCRVCGKITEKKLHCHVKTVQVKGIRWIDNNIVNFTATLIGGLSAALLYLAL